MDAAFVLPGFFGGAFPTGIASFTGPEGQAVSLAGLAATVMLLLLPLRAVRNRVPRLEQICEELNWDLGELWVVDSNCGVLRRTRAWYGSSHGLDEFDASSRDMTFAYADGLPGRAWATGRPTWVRDVVQDPEFRRTSMAARAGLRSALAVPLRTGGELDSIMTLFSREVRRPQGDFLLRSLLLLPVGAGDARRLFASH